MEYPNQTQTNPHFQSLPPHQSFYQPGPPHQQTPPHPFAQQPHQPFTHPPQHTPPNSIHQSPVPTSSSSSPFPQDPHGRFAPQHPNQGQWNGTVGSGYPLASSSMSMSMSMGMGPTSSMANTSMLPPGMMQQQQFRGPQNIYASAPYTQGTATPTISTPQHRQFNSTANTPNHGSPYAPPQNQNRQPNASEATPPMSKPQPIQTSQPPAASQSTPQAAAQVTSPSTPLSPSIISRERQRVALLLEINSNLLQEIVSLQIQDKGGVIGQQLPVKEEDAKGPNPVQKPPSKDYVDLLLHLQANLAYLAQLNPNKPVTQIPARGPARMDPPASQPELEEQYTKLKGLFPGWNGMPKPSPSQSNAALPGRQQQSNMTANRNATGSAIAASS